eukprot:COSAG02_NODE_2740_length_8124_cov_16.189283_5_plen_81_part_00
MLQTTWLLPLLLHDLLANTQHDRTQVRSSLNAFRVGAPWGAGGRTFGASPVGVWECGSAASSGSGEQFDDPAVDAGAGDG